MASTSDFKNGLCIEYNSQLWKIVQFQHVKPGKGAAFVRTKLKNLKTGRVLENTFNAGVKVNTVRVERRPYQFLYKDDMGYNFMHTETFEQVPIEESFIERPGLLKEGQIVEINFHAEEEIPLTLDMPATVEMLVTYAEPSEKGNTASTTALKRCNIETGAEIMVPLFITEGETIKIDTESGSYAERVKK